MDTTGHGHDPHRKPHALGLLGAAVLATCSAARADPTVAPTSLEEVVVTAQKRSENLQSVPISLEAIDSRRLAELKITDFSALEKYIPSLSFQTVGPGQAQIYFRGITNGTDGNHVGSSPMVGVYLDEQPVTTIGNTLDPHVYDMARIEALSGPQGTLFGANSMEGTVRYITNKPDHTGIYGGYDLSVSESRRRGISEKIEGFLNVPINDQMAIRLVGFGERDAGFIDNILGPPEVYPTSGVVRSNAAEVRNNFNNVGTSGGRAQLKIDLNDRWTVTPSVMYQKQGAYGSFGYQPALGDLATAQYGPSLNDDRWYQSALTIEGKIGNLDLTYSGGYMRRTIDNVFDYSDYSYAYDKYYESTPAYFGNLFLNNAGQPISPAQSVVGHDVLTKRSHELRLSSPATDRLRFVLGVFYQAQRDDTLSRYEVAGLADTLSITGQPGVHYLDALTRYDTDRAVFGEVTYSLTDHLILTAGARVFDYRTDVNGFFGFPAYPIDPSTGTSYYNQGEVQCTPTPHVPKNSTLPCTNVNARSAGGKYTDKFTLSYKFDPDKMVYATYSTGFRPGGINRNPNVAPYRPDYLENQELGWKTSWLGRTLRFNGALFHEIWKDAQFGTYGQYDITQIINSGGERVHGIESEVEWLPVDGLNLTAAATYLWDHTLTAATCHHTPIGPNCATADDPTGASNTLAPAGITAPVSPRFKGNLVARYELDVHAMRAHVQAAGTYQSSVIPLLSVADELVAGTQPAYGSMDLAAGVARSNWTLEVSAENVSDRRGQVTRYISCSSNVCTAPYLPTGPYAVPIRPRIYTLQFSQKF